MLNFISRTLIIFLNKIKKLEIFQMEQSSVKWALYPNIQQVEGLASLRKFLETRANEKISSETLTELSEVVLKNKIYEFDDKTFKQKLKTVIGTKFAHPYAILFMADFEEKDFEKKLMIWWRHVDNLFFIWEHDEESFNIFIEQVNMFHSTIKFTAEYSIEKVNFLDVNIKLTDGELRQICLLNL